MRLQLKLLTLYGLFININGLVSEIPFYRSDYTFIPEINGWLKFHRVPAPWNEARRRCLYEGATLCRPFNQQVLLAMRSVLSYFNLTALYTGQYTTFSRDDGYSSVDFPYFSRSIRQRHQLTYSKNLYRCAIISKDTVESEDCDSVYPYLCYKKLTDLTFNLDCGTTDKEYHYQNYTGHCYKVHKTSMDWTSAFTICSAEGAYLAIPSDVSEAHLIAGLAKSENISLSSIGYRDWEGDDEWYTIHGYPITYARWLEDKDDASKKCAALSGNSVVVKMYCDDPLQFICEKHPASLQKIKNFH